MKLLFILDDITFGDDYLQIARNVEKHCDMLWYRVKDISAAEIYVKACALRKTLKDKTLILSEHADIALAAGFNGVHLGSGSIPAAVVKNTFTRLIVGYSAHSAEECSIEADYVTLSPVFDTAKPYKTVPLGAIPSPAPNVFALGGINAHNVNLLKGLGYKGVAGISMYKEIDTVYRLLKS